MWDVLGVYNQFSQFGLQDNMVYDVIPIVPLAIGNTTVNATIFEPQCGVVPSAFQSAFEVPPTEMDPGGALWDMTITNDLLVKLSVPSK